MIHPHQETITDQRRLNAMWDPVGQGEDISVRTEVTRTDT